MGGNDGGGAKRPGCPRRQRFTRFAPLVRRLETNKGAAKKELNYPY